MGIVAFALRYRHTFYVLALMMLFLGGSAILTTPKDIFPIINIPVVSVIWQYTGLTPEEMEQRVATYSEYAYSTNVSDIRNMESQSLEGITVEKIFFQPNVDIRTGTHYATAVHQTITLLFDLDQTIQELTAERGLEDAACVRLTGIYHNLIRYWADP